MSETRTVAGEQLSPARSMSRKDGVVVEIRRAIVTGALLPGQKLTELDLAKNLEVSRQTVREALAQLTREGLLVQEPYKGIHVASPSAQDIMDLALLRESLDLLALDQLLKDPTGEALKQVAAAWETFKHLENDEDPLVRHQAHIAFHHAIWLASGSSTLLHVAPVVEGLITVALARDLQMRQDPQREHSIHEKYVAAILSGDHARATKAIHDHTVGSASELVHMLG